ncbi:MAG TPA: hypothetical protein VEB64_17405 [Azospirillaceae bacterium]|nr:hypothetical protein [Azospirillaceae bacterium]
MDADKFAKVLALVDSDHHGEALSALRAARSMLARAGMSFHDLARQVRKNGSPRAEPEPAPPPPPPPSPPSRSTETAHALARVEELEHQIRELEHEVRKTHKLLSRQQRTLDRQKDETERWRKLARDTAEQLWDMGRALEQQARLRLPPPADRWLAIIEHLRDPRHALLSDREIARRAGVAPHMVALWRRRLHIGPGVRRISRGFARYGLIAHRGGQGTRR